MGTVFSSVIESVTSPVYKAAKKAFNKAFMKGETWSPRKIAGFCQKHCIDLSDLSDIVYSTLSASRHCTGRGDECAVIHALKFALIALDWTAGEEKNLSYVIAASPRVDRSFHVFETHELRVNVALGEGVEEIQKGMEEAASKARKAGSFNYNLLFPTAKLKKEVLDAYADALMKVVSDKADKSPLYKVMWAAMQKTLENMKHETSSVRDKVDDVQDLIIYTLSVLVGR